MYGSIQAEYFRIEKEFVDLLLFISIHLCTEGKDGWKMLTKPKLNDLDSG